MNSIMNSTTTCTDMRETAAVTLFARSGACAFCGRSDLPLGRFPGGPAICGRCARQGVERLLAATRQPEPAPADDIRAACVELAAFSGSLNQEEWDVLRRVIATLRGVADEIGGLVRPGGDREAAHG